MEYENIIKSNLLNNYASLVCTTDKITLVNLKIVESAYNCI